LRIVDYCHGFTGSAHDAAAFEHTCAFKHPEFLFQGEEFAWADSAYTLTPRMIPVHRQPALFFPENATFDHMVAHLRIRSEHCMGALKGCFQCLHGLRVNINNTGDHKRACRWITIAIILHNLIIDVEGQQSGALFAPLHTAVHEREDHGERDAVRGDDAEDGELKRQRLIAELLAYRLELA
jgi:DDE superfamily endonuclease